MDTEKAQQVLDELKGVRPEYLNEPAKRLFKAIMTIADERDMYRRQVNDAFDRGWIHKDKILREIEELKFIEVEGEAFSTAVKFAIKILQDILERSQNEKRCKDE